MERINWDLPLETDEETPRPAALEAVQIRDCPKCVVIESRLFSYTLNGEPMFPGVPRIRNVRTVDTSRDDAFHRMEALIRRVADHGVAEATEAASTLVEAREIVKLLPAPPVDPLLIEARRIAQDTTERVFPDFMVGAHDGELPVRCALAGLKRGQELAHGEYEVCGGVSYSRGQYPTYQRRSEAAGIEPGK